MACDRAYEKARSISGDSFYNGNYKVIEQTSLLFSDMENNNNKYYNTEIHEGTGGEYRIYSRYGRVSKGKGQTFVAKYTSLGAAQSDYAGLVREKEGKGYAKLDIVQSTMGSEEANKKVDVAAMGSHVKIESPKAADGGATKSKLTKAIQEFVIRIYEEANQMVSLGATGKLAKGGQATPLGNLGVRGIREARMVLDEIIRELHGGNSRQRIIQLNNEYYTRVPRKLPGNLRKEVEAYRNGDDTILITTRKRVQEEFELLDVYESALKLAPVMGTTDIDAKYAALNSDIRHISGRAKGDKETLAYIERRVQESTDQGHGYKVKVLNVYEVNQKNAPAFDDRGQKPTRLFHGSRSANMVGILSSHLRLPGNLGSGVHITGAMFGPGLYFASNSTKSLNYSFGSWAGKGNKYPSAYVFLADVGLGNIHKVDRGNYFMAPPAGYDSVMGVAGVSLRNHEFIVYKENQARLRYIIEVEKIR